MAELEWCEDRATSLSLDADMETFEVTHQCRHAHGHDGEHSCWLCTFSWVMEVCS